MIKLTVAEYAEKYSITKQAVYKRLDSLKTIEETRNGRKITLIIEEEGENAELNPNSQPDSTHFQPNSTYEVNQSKPDSTPFQPETTQDIQLDSTNEYNQSQPNSTPKQKEEGLTKSIIEILQKQLEEKDRQIERLQEETKEKDKQLKEQFDRLSALLMRSQELEALTHKLLKQGEAAEEPQEIENQEESVPEDQEPQKKKSVFSRLFKRNKKGGY